MELGHELQLNLEPESKKGATTNLDGQYFHTHAGSDSNYEALSVVLRIAFVMLWISTFSD